MESKKDDDLFSSGVLGRFVTGFTPVLGGLASTTDGVSTLAVLALLLTGAERAAGSLC